MSLLPIDYATPPPARGYLGFASKWIHRVAPYVLRVTLYIIFGAAMTVSVAWVCAMWSPIRTVIKPFPNPGTIPDTTDLDGTKGLHYFEAGVGWSYSSLCGTRYTTKNNVVWVNWAGPYGGTFHRVAGWPLPAVWSRVEVLDSQASNRIFEGEPEHLYVTTQRVRWELPLSEIIHRGIATKDLPGWFHAEQDRRLPLVPLLFGFLVNTAVYALFLAFIVLACKTGCRLWTSRTRHVIFIQSPEDDQLPSVNGNDSTNSQ